MCKTKWWKSMNCTPYFVGYDVLGWLRGSGRFSGLYGTRNLGVGKPSFMYSAGDDSSIVSCCYGTLIFAALTGKSDTPWSFNKSEI